MFKKILLILLSALLIFCCVGCASEKESVEVQVNTSQQTETTETENSNTENLPPIAQGISKYEKENLIAIKYLIIQEEISKEFNEDFVKQSDEQIKYTLTNVFKQFATGVQTFEHKRTNRVTKDNKLFFIDMGIINGYNYKTVFTPSATDNRYIIINMYIELDGDTSDMDAILEQSFSKDLLNSL